MTSRTGRFITWAWMMIVVLAPIVVSACNRPPEASEDPTVPAVVAGETGTRVPSVVVEITEARATPDPLIPTLSAAAPQATPPLTTTSPLTGTEPSSAASAAGTPAPATDGLPLADRPTEEPISLRHRLGVGVPLGVTSFDFDEALAQRLGMGWYLDWSVESEPVRSEDLEFVQMIRVRESRFFPSRSKIAEALAANPGSLWLIGNEPDVLWQDKTPPEAYAQRYHELWVFIKTLDPSAQVAIGGVSQVTPLRLSYLERVLAAYQALYGQPLPVDVWNMHAFILREERDSWGVSIPPGFQDVQQGLLWEIEDHDDLDLLRQQVIDFRRWMARHGQRDKPLLVSEYGILMPEEFGFPQEAVADYMRKSFDLLLNTRDPELGYPADDNRLVQRLAWYSLSDTTYPTGNLVDPTTGELTPLGEAFVEYGDRLDTSP